MAWNEPGGNKDPWSRKPKGNSEVDKLINEFSKSFKDLLGGSSGGSSGCSGANKKNTSIFIALIAVFYLLSGIYIVNDGERGVVLQFGSYHSMTSPGPHWVPRLIQKAEIVDVSKIRSSQQKAVMLTEDENIVSVNFAIQYDVKDASDFIFNLRDPDETLSAAGESAIREVVGKNSMDFIITEGREEIASNTKDLLQRLLDEYQSGINVQTVNILEAQPQEQVQDLSYTELRSRLPQEISNDIVQLLANSKQALMDFANIQTGEDIAAFNQQYDVNLTLPQGA